MALIFQILLGLLLLGSFVACYFSAKYWHWSHVLLTETVFILGLVFLILAGEVFRIQNIYGTAYQRNSETIGRLERQVNALKFGTDDPSVIATLEAAEVPIRRVDADGEDEDARMMSVSELDHQLGMITRIRGRVWRDVETAALDPESLTITLRIPAPDPHGVQTNSVLYVFEQGEAGPPDQRGRQYIGEFRVVEVGPQQIQIQPTGQFDERSVQRLQQTQSPWILYENMPVDEHPDGRLEIFAGATPEQLQQMLPAASVEEYIRHGTPARADDDQWHRMGYDANGNLLTPDNWTTETQFRYRRPLRDYNLLFQELSKRFTQMQADFNALVADNEQLQSALASAQRVQQLHEAQQADLQRDLQGVTRDRQAIESHQTQVKTQLTNAQALLGDAIEQNASLGEALQ